MKRTFLLIYFSFRLICYGQSVKIISNTTRDDSTHLFVFNQFNKKFDIIVAYTETNVLYDEPYNYKVIAIRGKLFHLIKISQDRKTLMKISFKDSIVKKKPIISLLNSLSKIGLWRLNNDSLNNHCYKINDSLKHCMIMTDGIDYSFQIITPKYFKKVETSNPEGYINSNMPSVIQRKIFVQCRELFKDYWLKN